MSRVTGGFSIPGCCPSTIRGVILVGVPGSPGERTFLARGLRRRRSLRRRTGLLLLYEEGSDPARTGGRLHTYLRPTDGSDATRLGDGRALGALARRAVGARCPRLPEPIWFCSRSGRASRAASGAVSCIDVRFFSPTGAGSCTMPTTRKDSGTYIQDVEAGRPPEADRQGRHCTVTSFLRDGSARSPSFPTRAPPSIRQTARKTLGSIRGVPRATPLSSELRRQDDYPWALHEEPLCPLPSGSHDGAARALEAAAPPDMTGSLRRVPDQGSGAQRHARR